MSVEDNRKQIALTARRNIIVRLTRQLERTTSFAKREEIKADLAEEKARYEEDKRLYNG